MNSCFKTLILTSAALCATAAFAASQARVNVPFSFTTKGQSFPAGDYEVSLDSRNNFVTMASKSEPTRQIIRRVEQTDVGEVPVMLDFDKTRSGYTLQSIQFGTWATPKTSSRSRRAISATTSFAGE